MHQFEFLFPFNFQEYYHGDDFVIREGERGDTFYIINKGSVCFSVFATNP